MDALTSIFPVLVTIAALLLAFFALRLDRRLSRGSKSAGPREPARPEQVGLQRTPWELKALDDQIRAGANRQARQDLVLTVNRLTAAAGINDPAYTLNTNANDHMIANVIAMLEQRLELAPLDPMLGSPHR